MLIKYNTNVEEIIQATNRRKFLKEKLVEFERSKLLREMMVGSKTDALVLNYMFDGKIKTPDGVAFC